MDIKKQKVTEGIDHALKTIELASSEDEIDKKKRKLMFYYGWASNETDIDAELTELKVDGNIIDPGVIIQWPRTNIYYFSLGKFEVGEALNFEWTLTTDFMNSHKTMFAVGLIYDLPGEKRTLGKEELDADMVWVKSAEHIVIGRKGKGEEDE